MRTTVLAHPLSFLHGNYLFIDIDSIVNNRKLWLVFVCNVFIFFSLLLTFFWLSMHACPFVNVRSWHTHSHNTFFTLRHSINRPQIWRIHFRYYVFDGIRNELNRSFRLWSSFFSWAKWIYSMTWWLLWLAKLLVVGVPFRGTNAARSCCGHILPWPSMLVKMRNLCFFVSIQMNGH